MTSNLLVVRMLFVFVLFFFLRESLYILLCLYSVTGVPWQNELKRTSVHYDHRLNIFGK